MPTSAKPSSTSPSRRMLRKAGISRRRVRSPVAPKITSAQGGGWGWSRSAIAASSPFGVAVGAQVAVGRVMKAKAIIIVMGVSGSGKTTVAAMLAGALGAAFLEGDDLHPRSNVEQMKSGTPLTDADRLPWLQAIARKIDEWRAGGKGGVVTCSALKRAYRDILIGNRPEVRLVYLKGSHDL